MNKGQTETDLQHNLMQLLRENLEDVTVEVETEDGTEKRPVTVYEQHIPYVTSDEEVRKLYPGVVVRLLTSDRANFTQPRVQRVGIYIGVYDEGLDPAVPHQWLWVIAHQFQFLFETRRVIGNFVLQKPPMVVEPEEVSYPVYAIGMELSFEMPSAAVPTGKAFERMI